MTSGKVDVDDIIERAKKQDIGRAGKHVHTPSYGSRYFKESIPKYTFPPASTPAKVAYRLVHDELVLDGNPAQNMASFVTTWMEPEALELISETYNKNLADSDEYPQTQEIHQRCVSMLLDLFHAPNQTDQNSGNDGIEKHLAEKSKGEASSSRTKKATHHKNSGKDVESSEEEHRQNGEPFPKKYQSSGLGTSTIGSSEAFMLAALALKFNWRNRMRKLGKPCDRPNLVLGHNAQVALEKFCLYFDVEPRFVDVTISSEFVLDVDRALELVDENTIAVVAILGSTYTGMFEDVKYLDTKLRELFHKTGLYVPIHVDAASGGFIAPFLFPALEWDFRLEMVRSINVSGHKYGLVLAGVGWVLFKDKSDLPKELVFHINYLGGDLPTMSLNFSRSASGVVAQYYNFLRLGFQGYKDIVSACQQNACLLQKCLESTGLFAMHSDPKNNLPVVSWSLLDMKDDLTFDEHDLMHRLRQKGWIVPAYSLPPSCAQIFVLRAVVREGHSEDMMEYLFRDILWAYNDLKQERELVGKNLLKRMPSDDWSNEDPFENKGKKRTAQGSPHVPKRKSHHTYNKVC